MFKIEIKNYNKSLTNEQIEALIKLLPNKYQNLDVEIICPYNKWHCLKWLYQKSYYHNIKDIFKGVVGGSSCIYYNKLFVYVFNYDLKSEYGDIEKLRMIKSLYHEIRHQWQRYNNPIQFQKYNLNDTYKNSIAYDKYKHEIDANGFANNMMNKHYNKICEILNRK